MVHSIEITFLGTASAQPSATRNHTCIAVRLDGDIWFFDVGEGSQHQLLKSNLKPGKIEKIFITHMHGDHLFGLAPLLCTISSKLSAAAPVIQIYGPSPLRLYLRQTLNYTSSRLGCQYTVHELLRPTDPVDTGSNDLHPNEILGTNIFLQPDGHWDVLWDESKASVIATPIIHTVPSLAFILREHAVPGSISLHLIQPHLDRNAPALLAQGIRNPRQLLSELQKNITVTLPDGTLLQPPPERPGRLIVILGDTSDPSSVIPHVLKEKKDVDILIHEATNALTSMDPPTATFESVEALTIAHGHSTPQMAGRFAKQINARRLVLTHFSSRYSDNEDNVMGEIKKLAEREFGSDKVDCAKDLWFTEVARIES